MVYPTIIGEPLPKCSRNAPRYKPLIPLEKRSEFFAHRIRPCYNPFEPESVEHIIMKNRIANELHDLNPIIDYPLGKRIIDIFIPTLNLAIECQSSQLTGTNVKRTIRHHTKHKVLTTFIWGHRIFSRLFDTDGPLNFYKLKATVAEDTYLSRIPILSSDGTMRELVEESLDAKFEPRSYIYFEDYKLYWLHIFRNNKRQYFGTKHDFKGSNVQLVELNTDIGLMAIFKRRKSIV